MEGGKSGGVRCLWAAASCAEVRNGARRKAKDEVLLTVCAGQGCVTP